MIDSDFRLAMRRLSRAPIQNLFFILVLGLGMGFAAASHVLSTSYEDSDIPGVDDLLHWNSIILSNGKGDTRKLAAQSVSELNRTLAGETMLLGWKIHPAEATANGQSIQINATGVTESYFSALPIRAIAGRVLESQDFIGDGSLSIVISENLAAQLEMKPEQALGTSLIIAGAKFRIVGVLPQPFAGIDSSHQSQAWAPHSSLYNQLVNKPNNNFHLEPDKTGLNSAAVSRAEIEQQSLREQIQIYWSNNRPSDSGYDDYRPVTMQGLHTNPVSASKAADLARMYRLSSVLLLLVACINLGGLLLAKLPERSNELNIRIMLGSPLSRIARLIFADAALIVLLGGFTGILTGWSILRLLESLPVFSGTLSNIQPGFDVVWFFALSLLIALLISGGIPVIRFLQTNTRSGVGTRIPLAKNRAQQLLVGAQAAISSIVLSSALLLGYETFNLYSKEYGIEARDVQIISTGLKPDRRSGNVDNNLFSSLRKDVSSDLSRQNISDVAWSSALPYLDPPRLQPVYYTAADGGRATIHAMRIAINGNFFQTLSIPVIRKSTSHRGEYGVYISQSFAQQVWGTDDVLGKRLRIGQWLNYWMDGRDAIVTGVVADAAYRPGRTYQPILYSPLWLYNQSYVIAKTNHSANSVARIVDRNLQDYYPDFSANAEGELAGLIDDHLLNQKFATCAVIASAGFAALLAILGSYTNMLRMLSTRKREIAIRTALGSTGIRILFLLGKQFSLIIGSAMLAGMPVWFLVSKWVPSSNAHSLSQLIASYILACSGMCLTMLLLSVLPAWRTTRIEPGAILREL